MVAEPPVFSEPPAAGEPSVFGEPLARTAPPPVRALGVLLVLELATFASLTVLALIAAALSRTADRSGGFADLAATLSLVVAGAAAVLTVLTLAAGLALRGRRRSAIALAVAVHAVPVLLLAVVVRSLGGLLGFSLAWTGVAVVGLTLTLWPATRAWAAGWPGLPGRAG